MGGDINDPKSSPQYTTEPRKPNSALSICKSFFMVSVHAGSHPWSTLISILVTIIMIKKNFVNQGLGLSISCSSFSLIGCMLL